MSNVTICELVVHFNKNATETIKDKLKHIMLREVDNEKTSKSDKKWLESPWQVFTGNIKQDKYIKK